MTLEAALQALERMGSEQTRKVLYRHGARDLFGVKIGDIKKLIRETGRDHSLALQLYDTGNSDAMYMAGLIADPHEFSRDTLEAWSEKAYWYLLSEVTVAGVAAESPYALELARKWINSPVTGTAASGWAVWCGILALGRPSVEIGEILDLITRIENQLHDSADRVRYCMNSFIISVGVYIPELTQRARRAARRLGKVKVFMGETSCKVPDALSYIRKVEERGKIGVHKKRVIC